MPAYTDRQQVALTQAEVVFQNEEWTFSRTCLGDHRWTAATKEFESAGGARSAMLYLRASADREGGLYLNGKFESAGEDVLATHLLEISSEQLDRVSDLLQPYIQEAIRRINQAWGRKLLGFSEPHLRAT